MKIIACIKMVPDPETPAHAYAVDNSTMEVILPPDISLVISSFDENAVEAGLQLREAIGGSLTVLSLVPDSNPDVIRCVRHALAMGADNAIVLEITDSDLGDSHSTAYSLAMAINKIGEYDLILCGRQAADWDAGQVGLGIAAILDLPAATPVRKIESCDDAICIERIAQGGYEKLELPLPAVLCVSNEANTPRIAPLRGVLTAAKKEIVTWSSADIGAGATKLGEIGRKTLITELSIPTREGSCELISADTLEDVAIALATKLRSKKII